MLYPYEVFTLELNMQIISAIDIIDGKCVRLTQGDYTKKKVYNEDPLEVAKSFEDSGITRLHLVDLDGAKARHIINHKTLENIATHTQLHIDFGGGIKSDSDIEIAFNSGAKQVTGGTIAVKNKDLFLNWLEKYGSERIILGADVLHGNIAIHGWQETADLPLNNFLTDYTKKGIQYAICTDVSKDGLLAGTALDLYREIRTQFPDLRLIASGGVTTIKEIDELEKIGCFGVIIGKAIYEGRISLEELSKFQ